MNLNQLVSAVLTRTGDIAKEYRDSMPLRVDICESEDIPGTLELIMEMSSGHLEPFSLKDDQPFTGERWQELEELLLVVGAVGCGLSSSVNAGGEARGG